MDRESLHREMEHEDFIRFPMWAGHCRETSSLTRTGSSLLEDSKDSYGNGLFTRSLARLTELAQFSASIQSEESNPVAPSDTSITDAPGIGAAHAARGLLIHRVKIAADKIEKYQVLAPTEWNFHPEGVVARSLETLTGNRDQLKEKATMVISAIDPCVSYDLEIL